MRLAFVTLLLVSTLQAVTYRVTANVTSFKITHGRWDTNRQYIPGRTELTLRDELELPHSAKAPPRQQVARQDSSPGYRVLGRVSRIDPVTSAAEVDIEEPLVAEKVYRIINETGETIGTAQGIKLAGDGSYSFTFESKRRTLSAGRRIILASSPSNFSALADRPRAQKEQTLRFDPKDNVPMVFIPEGTFVLGGQQVSALHFIPAEREGRAANRLDLAGFFIDQHEVSIGQYLRYLQETRQQIPEGWEIKNERLPLTHMTYTEAERYCSWSGKRLPTELEWEKAARGTQIISNGDETYAEARSYPVAHEMAAETCVTSDNASAPLEIDRLKDKNAFGLIGMCGNAAEWTSSWLLPYRGNTVQDERFGKRYKVIRGGSYEHSLDLTKSYVRLAGGIPSLARDRRAGFRCARSE